MIMKHTIYSKRLYYKYTQVFKFHNSKIKNNKLISDVLVNNPLKFSKSAIGLLLIIIFIMNLI